MLAWGVFLAHDQRDRDGSRTNSPRKEPVKHYNFRGIIVLVYPFLVELVLVDQDLSVEVTYVGDARLGGYAEEKLSTLVGEK